MPRGRWSAAVLLLAAAACTSDGGDAAPATSATSGPAPSTSSAPAAAAVGCEPRGVESTTGLAYPPLDGPPDDALLVDVHVPVRDEGCPPVPAMVWVHGGAWSVGSRSNGLDDKVDLFVREQGWALVSVDYRLSPRPIDLDAPDAVRLPTHTEDVAAAVGWVHREADRFGIDAGRLGLMGHSAGAQIVALVATDERYLDEADVPRGYVGCVVVLDTEGFDVTAMAPGSPIYQNAFTTDPETWREASALLQIDDGEPLPEVLAVVQDRPQRRARNEAFVDALAAAGGAARLVVAAGLDHREINQAVGRDGDEVVTPAIVDVLDRCGGPGEA